MPWSTILRSVLAALAARYPSRHLQLPTDRNRSSTVRRRMATRMRSNAHTAMTGTHWRSGARARSGPRW